MSEATSAPLAAQIYRDLGVRRVINAADTYTALGGGRLPEPVVAAMAAASEHHVHVEELLAAVGARIAGLVGVPAALVVNGAAAGLAVTAAACLVGTDPGGVDGLPGRVPVRDEIIALRSQRNSYDRAVLATGARLVEVGYADSTPPWSLTAALSERTAAVTYYAGTQFERFAMPLPEVAAITKAAGVPLIVDAAAQLPPVSNLHRYVDEGADLVVFSGGKGLRGPQSSGLVLGDADLVAACAANSYPHHSVGRAMKTSKENALGLLAAVERAVALDWDAEYARWQATVEAWAQELSPLPGVRTWIVPTGRLGQTCPRLYLAWESGPSAAELARRLEGRDPSVVIGLDLPGARECFLNPYSVLAEENDHLIAVVGAELRSALDV